MVKIGIMCNSLSGSIGVDRVAYKQAESLAKEGNQVTIFTFMKEVSPPKGVEVFQLSMPKGFYLERFWRILFPINIIALGLYLPKLNGFEVVYSHQYPLSWLAYIGKKVFSYKYIYYHHHLNPPEAYQGTIQQTYARLLNGLTLWTATRADHIISISEFSRKSLLDAIGRDSEIISNEIDAERFHPNIDGKFVREKYGIQNSPVILFVGGLAPPKRVHLLIEAFYLVKSDFPEAKLVIVGKVAFDDYYQKIKGMCDSSVIFTGYIPDEELPYYYAACNVYATASLWEGFDLPAVEAQACGKSVVAFDIGSHSEVINPKNGRLVPANDTKALANAIIEYLSKSGQ
ncbi:MAG TPA: hypothetical protein DEG09_00710 [Marinilabiliaceae bacterium]|nr:hypothetical protein [Marinilabiliaceae bacterium]